VAVVVVVVVVVVVLAQPETAEEWAARRAAALSAQVALEGPQSRVDYYCLPPSGGACPGAFLLVAGVGAVWRYGTRRAASTLRLLHRHTTVFNAQSRLWGSILDIEGRR
jgi:hypothetical protein